MTKQKKPKGVEQSAAFIAAARELGCDDDEEAFDKKLKAVASVPPDKAATKKKAKKSAR